MLFVMQRMSQNYRQLKFVLQNFSFVSIITYVYIHHNSTMQPSICEMCAKCDVFLDFPRFTFTHLTGFG